MSFPVFRSINRNDLVEYITTHYKGPRMVLAAAGGQYGTLTLNHMKLCLNPWPESVGTT